MNKYKLKPLEIEAVQLTNKTFRECVELIGHNLVDCKWDDSNRSPCFWYISFITEEGNLYNAYNEDYIIRDSSGNLSSKTKESFEEEYEKV